MDMAVFNPLMVVMLRFVKTAADLGLLRKKGTVLAGKTAPFQLPFQTGSRAGENRK